jgi:hypothetical protein
LRVTKVVAGELEHGEVADVGVRHFAHDLVADRSVGRERAIEVGDAQAEVKGSHGVSSLGR